MNLDLVIQVLFVIVIIGVAYSLWRTTRAYGGLVGVALKWIGIGMVFFSVEALDRALRNFSVLSLFNFGNASLVHDGLMLLGLLFSGIGFSKLTKIATK